MRLAYAALLSAAVAARTVAARPAHLVADLAPEAIRGAIEPFAPAVATGDDLYFEAVDPTYFGQLWRTNGSPGDLKRVTSVEGGGIRAFAAVDGVVYYFGFEPPGITLRKITPLAEDAEAVASFADTDGLAIVGDTLVFAANDGVHGWEPWQSDGTPGGTSILADLVPGGGNSDPFGFTRADGTFAFFFAATDAGQAALWRTDGTAAGTRRVAGFGTAPAEGFRPSVLGVVGGEL
ncbi:MAG TPA: ELWxxDGT repeat protein, partial [Thermoanaerobaculia bacterium]|nr:ELWxxDGT repeat protein [Thermoanaerobaculia bacterium]